MTEENTPKGIEPQSDPMTAQEVADWMRTSQVNVLSWIKAGYLQASTVGKGYRIWKKDLLSYVASQAGKRSPAGRKGGGS